MLHQKVRVQAMLKHSKIMDAQQKYKEHLDEQVADGDSKHEYVQKAKK